MGFPIDEAVIDFQTICEAGIVSPAYGVWKLLDEQRVDMEYLRKYLRSDSAVAQYKLRLRGTTARRRSLTKEAFQSIQIPLPPLEEQRRIAAILDEMGALIEKVDSELSVLQKVQHSRLDEVLRRSPQVPLKTYVDSIQSGKSVKEASTDEVCNRVLKISAVTSGIFEPGESKPLPDDYTPADAHRVQKGDVLVSRANTAELVGASALVVDEVQNLYLPDKLWRLNLAQGAQAAVIVGILQNAVVRSRISAKASGSGGSMKNITQSAFLQVLVPQLSTGEQARLSSLLMLFGSVRELLHQKRLLLEDLRLSLSTRAFQGGL
ncbi:hypothetical protein HMPREF2912_05815 [Corynebacterium sp. HMSC056E09]|nr:hypothetical protein HMPREF2912_05815 [Corynebacterium sp. HMSC056E09]